MLRKRVKDSNRQRRKRRVRKKISGTTERPRLSVYRSNLHIYAQLIDDMTGHTVASASTVDKELKGSVAEMDKTASAEAVGKLLAERAKQNGFDRVVFDRNGYLYHGRIEAVAKGAREAGLHF